MVRQAIVLLAITWLSLMLPLWGVSGMDINVPVIASPTQNARAPNIVPAAQATKVAGEPGASRTTATPVLPLYALSRPHGIPAESTVGHEVRLLKPETLDGQQLLQNVGFDTGAWEPWQVAGIPEISDLFQNSEPFSAWLGGYDGAQDFIGQTVVVPAEATTLTLTFWALAETEEVQASADRLCYDIANNEAFTVINGPYCYDPSDMPHREWQRIEAAWSGAELAPMQGQPITLLVYVLTDDSNRSSAWIDDVTLTATLSQDIGHSVRLPVMARLSRPGPQPTPATPQPVPTTPRPAPTTPQPAPTTPQPDPTTQPPGPVTPEPPASTRYYVGISTLDVWYKASPFNPQEHKQYQQTVRVEVGPPLQGDDGTVEQNPFYFCATQPQYLDPGHFVIHSAVLWAGERGESSVFQYWRCRPQEDGYTGVFQPHAGGSDNFNIIVAEDHTDIIPFCVSPIAPGATVDIRFSGDRVWLNASGLVTDEDIPQLCVRYIERFEVTLEAILQ